MTDQHERRTILVTGGNQGIGLEAVKQLAARGHSVWLASRDIAKGQAAADALGFAEATVRVVALDVTDEASIAAAAVRIEREAGALDVLVNNAGILGQRQLPSVATAAAMREVYETNVFGVVEVTRAMLPLLRQGRARTIVNVSSDQGSLALHGYPRYEYAAYYALPYCSSKAALNAFTVLLAKDLRPEGFKVNAVNPGFTKTAFNAFNGTGDPAEAAEVVVRYALLDATGPTGGYFAEGGTLPW